MKRKIILVMVLLVCVGLGIYFYPQKETKEVPKKIIKENIDTVNTSFIGDLLYEQPYYDWMKTSYDAKGYYDLVKPYFQKDDLTVANMEVPIGGKELGVSGTGYSFNAPDEVGQQVVDMGIDALTLANNHANDAGIEGRIHTLDFFAKRNILTTGVYRSSEDRQNIRTKTINHITFSFLGYTYKTNKLDEANQDLIGYYRNLDTMKLDDQHKEIIKNEVTKAKQISDVVVVAVHWGSEFTHTINDEQKELANYLNELGVDIVMGHHSHCIQPIEWLEANGHKTLVIYSLGSFISADNQVTRASQEFANAYNVSMIVQVKCTKKDNVISIDDPTYIPIINYYDSNFENFKLYPLSSYPDELASTHNRYQLGLTKEYVSQSFQQVIDARFKQN